MGIIEKEISPLDYIFACTDNTIAVSWSCRTSFFDGLSAQLIFSHKLASLLVENDICLYTQYIKGILNYIMDSLSQFHILDHILTHLLLYCFPTQAPITLRILPLPKEIISFITGTLESCPMKNFAPQLAMPSMIRAGPVEFDFLQMWDSAMTNS